MLIARIKRFLIGLEINKRLSKQRLSYVNDLVGCDLTDADKYRSILEIGCANGKDFVQFCSKNRDVQITGVDIRDYGLRQDNFVMTVADAESLDFVDDNFDLTVSFGVLEHIQPIEKLCRVISEIERVSKSYVVIVPAVSSIVEPHAASLLWQLRDHNKKKHYPYLNYFSDEAWLQFEGFKGAQTKRFFHFFPFVSNLVIYKL